MDINSDRAYDRIRKRILTGEYGPGQALNIKVLAGDLGISPTPVRDALRQLETDGLVTIRARLGAKVNWMNLQEFQDLCELRLVLETHTAEFAAERSTQSDRLQIKHALEAMTRITAEIKAASDDKAFSSELENADIQFHLAIMVAAKNDLIRKEITRLHLVSRVVSGAKVPIASTQRRTPEEKAREDRYRDQVVREHEQIYQAIEKRDVAGAGQAMKRSLEGIFNAYILAKARAERETMARDFSTLEAVGS